MTHTPSDPRHLLIVEDDEAFARTLKRSFERRGYAVEVAHSPEKMDEILRRFRPGYAVVDLKLGGASGLACVQTLRALGPMMRIVVLTGFASIAPDRKSVVTGKGVAVRVGFGGRRILKKKKK